MTKLIAIAGLMITALIATACADPGTVPNTVPGNTFAKAPVSMPSRVTAPTEFVEQGNDLNNATLTDAASSAIIDDMELSSVAESVVDRMAATEPQTERMDHELSDTLVKSLIRLTEENQLTWSGSPSLWQSYSNGYNFMIDDRKPNSVRIRIGKEHQSGNTTTHVVFAYSQHTAELAGILNKIHRKLSDEDVIGNAIIALNPPDHGTDTPASAY